MHAASGQVTDSIALQPINPVANGSACPGQDLTLNCTIVRTVNNVQNVVQPSLSLIYSEHSTSITNDESSSPNDIFGAEFITGNYTVVTIVTIFSVPLSHHNSVIECQTSIVSESRKISIAGATKIAFVDSYFTCTIKLF